MLSCDANNGLTRALLMLTSLKKKISSGIFGCQKMIHAKITRNPQVPFMTIGDGLLVTNSTLSNNAGLGLFVTCDVSAGLAFTFYDGHLLHRTSLPGLNHPQRKVFTHVKAIPTTQYVINGLQIPLVSNNFLCSTATLKANL